MEAGKATRCQYDGTMEKATFRLPESLLQELRERAAEEGRSLNATAVDVIRQGLGRPAPVNPELQEVLGSMIARPAMKKFDPVTFALRAKELEGIDVDLAAALDWTRGDR